MSTTSGPTAPASGARRSGCIPHIRDENVVSMFEGGTNLFWAERYGRELGVDELWVKHVRQLAHRVVQGPGHDRAGVGGQADDRRRQADPAVACASTGDTSASLAAYAAAAGIRAMVILPRGKVSTAQLVQPLANGAQRAGARRRLRRLHGDRAAPGRGGRRVPREQHELAARRGPEDRRHRDRAAVRLGSARLDHHPRRQPRQRQRAGRRLQHDARAGADVRSGRASASRRPRPPTRSTSPTRTASSSSSPWCRKPTLASAIQIGNPVSVNKAIRTLKQFDGVVEQASETELADAAARADSHRHVQLPAHRRGAGGAGEAGRGGTSRSPTGWS